jgi:hypothetical protein
LPDPAQAAERHSRGLRLDRAAPREAAAPAGSGQSPYRITYRVKENVISSQLLALDSDTGDERSDFETLLADSFIGQYAALLHATASATPDAPRTRVIFLLEKPLAPVAYEQALRALLHRYPFCDQSVNHAAVVFYGARDCSFHLTGNILPWDALETQLLQPFAAFLERATAAGSGASGASGRLRQPRATRAGAGGALCRRPLREVAGGTGSHQAGIRFASPASLHGHHRHWQPAKRRWADSTSPNPPRP